MDGVKSEYDIIRSMSGIAYKLFNVIRLMTKDGHVDENGYVVLSHTKISMKLGIGNNISRIINDLSKYPDVVDIKHGDRCTPNKFKINERFL